MRHLAAGLVLPVALGLGAAEAHDSEPHAPASLTLEASTGIETGAAPEPLPLSVGGPFSLVDHGGRAVTDFDFRGEFLLIFFGYANCPGICPTGLRTMSAALDLLGVEGEAVTPLLITVDPARDTPEALATAVAEIHPRLIGLTGTLEELSAVARAYKVSARPAGRSWRGEALIDHGSFIYLVGPDGAFRTFFPPIMAPEAMAQAIAAYL
jgi:protein SCO1/2